jgi:hypothetical protein
MKASFLYYLPNIYKVSLISEQDETIKEKGGRGGLTSSGIQTTHPSGGGEYINWL